MNEALEAWEVEGKRTLLFLLLSLLFLLSTIWLGGGFQSCVVDIVARVGFLALRVANGTVLEADSLAMTAAFVQHFRIHDIALRLLSLYRK